ncbi:MAG: hypothetical protein JXA82_06065 [Sedimentisphaerales bacterium]|nr:hypothetical protein [Sedimentisphaerales bacterium]
MASDKFKLPRSSYEELCKIIIAYKLHPTGASLEDMEKSSGVSRTVVSANNSFLAAVEIIEGGNKKKPTEIGSNLGNALEHSVQNDIQRYWEEVITKNEFLNKMVMAVRVRKGMSSEDLTAHIAYSAGEAKTKSVATGARAVVDILRNSDLVLERDDKIIAAKPEKVESTIINETQTEKTQEYNKIIGKEPQVKLIKTKYRQHDVIVQLEIKINAKPEELDTLGVKVKKLLDEISLESNSD